jgi:multiple sugar transport system ATP-binding protein
VAGVVLEHVRKLYGDDEVIADLSLEVRDREFMVLVGPSGCGKSTVLRMIAGLEEISGGTISIGGRVVNALPPRDRDVAMVFQNYALYPHMSVRQNLDFGLRLRKLDRAEVARRVEAAAATLGIAELLDRKPRQLSGGQRQRVAVGRAIVRQPAVFLFDEPLSNLDAKLRVQMRAEITGLQRRLQTTAIYVTHDQVEAMTMGHRIALLDHGELQQVGTPLELYEQPANLFTARFIGTPPMNLLRAEVGADGATVRADGIELAVPGSLRAVTQGRAGREVVVGIRPEDITERPSGEADGATLPVTVDLVETLGHETVLFGTVAGGGAEPDPGRRIAAKIDPHTRVDVGAAFTLHARVGRMHLFDAESERRLDATGS